MRPLRAVPDNQEIAKARAPSRWRTDAPHAPAQAPRPHTIPFRSPEHGCQLCGDKPLEKFVVTGGTTLWRCRTCELYQCGNLVEPVAYEGEYHQGYSLRLRRKQLSAASRLSRVAPLVDCQRPRLLDVGCSVGATLLAARQRGWEAAGVDVSRDAVEFCRDKGLDCQTVDDFDLPFPDESFDVVTAWHVIEHVADVSETLREWRRVLRPGGILAMETPDASSRVVRRRGTEYRRFWAPEHTYTFTPDTLAEFVDRAGLERLSLPTFGRLSDLPLWTACYAVSRETLLLTKRLLGRHKAFLIFARRTVDSAAANIPASLPKAA
jgi:2-polyprenyl-3-methyl-5-hydroxy-6-metoxy-1,4-benzoquinol methylase